MKKALVLCLMVSACSAPPSSVARAPLNLSAAWPAHVVLPGSSTGAHRGADGTHTRKDPLTGKYRIVTSDEEGSNVEIGTLDDPSHPFDPASWSHVDVAISQCGPEDAKWGDFDGDGISDVAVACSGSRKLYFLFGNSGGTYTPVLITASNPGHGRWTQSYPVDMNSDGMLDLVAGGYAADANNVPVDAWFQNPGGGSKRVGSAWTYHWIRNTGQTMTTDCSVDWDGDGKLDCFFSDRKGVGTSPTDWTGWGDRWHHNGALDVPAGYPMGGNAICAGTTTGCVGAHGDPMFASLVDFTGDGKVDIVGGQWNSTSSTVAIYDGANPTAAAPWLVTYVTASALTSIGRYQGNVVADFDGSGRKSIAISTSKTDLMVDDPTKSGVIIALQQADGSFVRWEVSGGRGTKFDNVEAIEFRATGCFDIVTSEQNYDSARIGQADPNGPTGGMGVVIYENPTCGQPVEVDGAPDGGVDAAPDAPPDACGEAR
jgi:hypothetical protein